MKAILRESKTDNDMIEIITISEVTGKEMLWAIVHSDFMFLYDLADLYRTNGYSLEVEITERRRKL